MIKSSNNLPLIRLSSINPFLVELQRRSIDASACLRKLGLPETVPATSEVFVAPLKLYEFVERSAVFSQDPHIGYRIGREMDVVDWEPIALAADEAKTVGDLLLRLVMHAAEHSSATEFFLTTRGDISTFGFTRTVTPDLVPAQLDAFYVAFISQLLKRAASGNWDSAEALFTIAEPKAIPPSQENLRLAKGNYCGILVSFPVDWLFGPFLKSTFRSASTEHATGLSRSSLVESLRLALIPHVHEHDLTIDLVAKICGYEQRKLSEKLRKHGTTIAKEVARLRKERASKELLSSNRKVADIATAVGFADPTVFSRAFKRWTGLSPQQYRRDHTTTNN
jgi:AraC-like DNA-binding protein